VDADRWVRFVKLFESALAPGGAAVFTTYGRFIAEQRLRQRDHPLDLNEEEIEGVLRDYDEEGFGFRAGFCPEVNFGDCVATCGRCRRRAGSSFGPGASMDCSPST
jgi:hypothetical protein